MKEEIKEILETLKNNNCYSNFIDDINGGNEYYYLLEKSEGNLLLDYITNLQKSQETLIKNDNEIITNLQEENEKLKSYIKLTDEEAKEYMHDTKKEIERLNQYIDFYKDLTEKQNKEIDRLNNIINRMEEDLREMYMTFGEFNEEYTEKKIRELKEGK